MLLKFKKIDWFIVFLLFLFMGASTLLIHSAVQNEGPAFRNLDIKNVVLFGIGFVAFFCTSIFDYRLLVRFAYIFYGIGIILLITVYFFGAEINGSKGWFQITESFTIQPAELVKLALILMITYWLSRREGEPLEPIRDLIPVGAIVFAPFILVLIQPDLGNAIIYMVIFFGMLWIGNIKYSYVLIGTAVIVGMMALFIYLYQSYHIPIYDFLKEHRLSHWADRIDPYIAPQYTKTDANYQLEQSMIAIGSGGLSGEGYLDGQFVHSSRIPYAYSDSIFAVIGEEFGFLGASVLLLLYFVLIYRLILISNKSDNISGSFIIVGVVSMFVFQIFENVGMLLGLLPITGITLPFISYGGSSLLINMVSLGLVMSIKVHQEKPFMY